MASKARAQPSRASPDRPRRGRPQKFGRPARVVAMALPEDTIRALQRIDRDLAWAVVKLLEQSQPGGAVRVAAASEPDLALVSVAARRSLIVVNRATIPPLPGVNMIPLHGDRAFLALEPGCGLSELELAILDRLADPVTSRHDAETLARMRMQVAGWRHDRGLAFRTRAIIVVERARRGEKAAAARNRGRQSRTRRSKDE